MHHKEIQLNAMVKLNNFNNAIQIKRIKYNNNEIRAQV